MTRRPLPGLYHIETMFNVFVCMAQLCLGVCLVVSQNCVVESVFSCKSQLSWSLCLCLVVIK